MESVNPGRNRVINVTVACGILATVAVCLRLVARWRSKASFAADDWLMVASLVPSYAMLAVGSIMITSGKGGQHANTLTQSQMATFLKVKKGAATPFIARVADFALALQTLDASLITYSLTISMVKISILLLYRRLFDTVKFGRATLIAGMACIAWLMAALFCLALQCNTEAERYNPESLFSDQCIDLKAYWMTITSTNMALDLIILCMPLYMVWNLRLAIRQKLALSGIFALGALVCVASLMRILTIDLVKGADLTYTIITCYMWSQIEPTMAIVCACLTTLRPLFTGFNLSSLSTFSCTSSTSFSCPSTKIMKRWSDAKTDRRKKKQEREMMMMRWPFGHRNHNNNNDSYLLESEQVLSAKTSGTLISLERLEKENMSLGDDADKSLSVKSATSMV